MPLIVKPGSYGITLGVRPKFDDPNIDDPGPYFELYFMDYEPGSNPERVPCSAFVANLSGLPDFNPVVGEWMHVAIQMQDVPGAGMSAYFNGKRVSGTKTPFVGEWISPLFIDDIPTSTPHCYEGLRQFAWSGRVESVRVSKGVQFVGDLVVPERDLRADAETIALWRFEEVEAEYEDLSGNGHTMFGGGTLAVEARDKLTTTWGALKRSQLP